MISPTPNMIAEKVAPVGRLVFNKPQKHNATSTDMWEAIPVILDDFEKDPAIRVVVVTGAGDKAFVSGADISEFDRVRATQEAARHYGEIAEQVYARIHAFAKPTIAMIRGYCIGGGLNLAICCDMRYATQGARFALPAARLGLGYGHAGLRRFVETIGPVATKEIFFTARQVTADEALRWNMVNAVVADDALESTVMETANAIADNAPLTIAAVKRATVEILKDPSARDLAACDAMVAACFASEDYREGRRAFAEKRKPRFAGI
jgi:enoyl-CoA hydratase/carnithine racemase